MEPSPATLNTQLVESLKKEKKELEHTLLKLLFKVLETVNGSDDPSTAKTSLKT